LVKRLEIIPTPKQGSWLNIAENELSALTRQCVRHRRFATIEELREEVETWATQCNEKQKGVQWQLTLENARIKLDALYPKIKL
jgi:recombinational DNA repair ATPase RecF